MLPWLAILALLAHKPNRGWAAWWIWLPLTVVAAACHWLQRTLQDSPGNGPQEAIEIVLAVPVAWGFGLAALWLLASRLGRRHRFGTLLSSMAILAAFSVFSFGALVGWGLVAEPVASLLDPRHCSATASAGLIGLPLLVPLVLPAPLVAAALALCGLACWGRYRPVGLYFWLVLSLLPGWIAVSALLHRWCHVVLPGCAGYALFFWMAMFLWVVLFAVWLPFLILAPANPLFRERLKALLHVNPPAPAAVRAPASLSAPAPA